MNPHRARLHPWQYGLEVAGLIAWSLAMLWLCLNTGAKHDYTAYLEQWRSLLETGDPWQGRNTYGPLHSVIGLILPVNVIAPKVFMVVALLLANAALFLALLRERGVSPIQIVYLLAVPTNILVVISGVVFGLNDALIAALLVTAVLMRHQGKWVACGVLVGLAALTKFYPLLLLPFFAIDEGKVKWTVIKAGAIVFAAGILMALAVWGGGLIDAIATGADRRPKLLSALQSLRVLFGKEPVSLAVEYNSVVVVLGVAAALAFAWRARLSWLEGVVLGYLVMLTLYKVGHPQFYIPWLFLVAALPLLHKRSADVMGLIFIPAMLLLSLYQYGYLFGSDGYRTELRWVRDYGGFIAFSVSAASIALYTLYMLKRGQTAPDVPAVPPPH